MRRLWKAAPSHFTSTFEVMSKENAISLLSETFEAGTVAGWVERQTELPPTTSKLFQKFIQYLNSLNP